MTKKQKKMLIRILAAAVLMLILRFVPLPLSGIPVFLLWLVPYIIIGHDILRKAWPEQKGFFRIVPHQELMHFKPFIRQPSHTHKKSHRAASAQAGGFRVQIQDPPGIKIRRYFLFTHQHQGLPGQLQRAGKFLRRPVYRQMPAVRKESIRVR